MFMGVNCGVALFRRSSWWPVAHRVSREKVVVPHVNHRHIITVLAGHRVRLHKRAGTRVLARHG